MKSKNLINQTFGKLKVVSLNEEKTNQYNRMAAYWNCVCECGNTCIIRSSSLRTGNSKSCGCNKHKLGKNNPNFTGFEEIGGRYWNELKKQAINKRRLKFTISIEYAWNLFVKQNRECALTGMSIQFPPRDNDYSRTASLDRIDSTKGYIKGNVQWVHRDINYMKQEYSQNYFIELCEKVIIHKQNKTPFNRSLV